ncbi:carboxylesterase family protein [Paenibacillus glycanilyticus]|uniref:carboxylesterase/lipase family protein n=1 Tax=Paenibacillus glycanilyticus TaxID=126569 RepID=UPI00203D12BC|nr:carboxylesterase family protein [Paenibacillus glycanilyticus]MCM3628507.1 carboxylesterase family protein [Paenibacillus glycanilyticus]
MIIQTSSGQVKGVPLNGSFVFRGIPYAAAPAGQLRFKPPQPPPAWEGVRDCNLYGPIAHQNVDPNSMLPELEHSEDCLNLNVWTAGPVGQLRPVMVYIHGGGFISGKGADCDGSRYAAEDGMVYVSINYRLGALGYLYLGDVLGEEYAASGNNGMLDILAALRWVQTNIAAFGGDPGRVTVLGNSAGAKCTATLYAMKAAEGLFHRAIAQSGATQSIRDKKTASVTTRRLLDVLGLGPEEAGKLLELPAKQLIDAQMKVGPNTSSNLHMFGPVADGIHIPLNPLASVKEAEKLPPLLIGTNEDESTLFIFYDQGLQRPDAGTLERLFGENRLAAWDTFCRHSETLPVHKAWSKALTEHLYTIGSMQLAEAVASTGTPVWMYRLVYGGTLGATHGYEGSLINHAADPACDQSVLTDDPHHVPAEARQLAAHMRLAWNQFVRSGDPNASELPIWPHYNNKQSVLMFNLDSHVQDKLTPPVGIACGHQVWRA